VVISWKAQVVITATLSVIYQKWVVPKQSVAGTTSGRSEGLGLEINASIDCKDESIAEKMIVSNRDC
jgi:hypothetical protein